MIYLDHHAATPLQPAALAAMRVAQEHAWANPSSVHAAGRASRALYERAREQIAQAIGAAPADVVLTAGGTEACNLGVLGALARAKRADARLHVVTTRVEHPAVLEALRSHERQDMATCTWLDLPCGAPPEPAAFAAALRPETCLAAVQWVNHETGTILPVGAYAEHCRARGVLLFVDATQALGKLPVDVTALGADLVALAAHKIGGPAGAGALWIRRGVSIAERALGGSQERGRRAGTPDVVAQVGFGAACELLPERLAHQPRLAALRDRLEAGLLALGARRNALAGPRVATVTNLWWPGRRADVLLAALDLEGVAASAGAACSSGKSEPSAVLLAMHPDEPPRASASIRLSFGPEVIETDIESTEEALRRVLARSAI